MAFPLVEEGLGIRAVPVEPLVGVEKVGGTDCVPFVVVNQKNQHRSITLYGIFFFFNRQFRERYNIYR